MLKLGTFIRSAVGKKGVMAMSGLILFGYVLLHMLGNLKLYQGPEKLNAYAEWLREFGMPLFPYTGVLWIVRIILFVSVILHIWAAVELTLRNRRARPQPYVTWRRQESTYAAHTMRWGGLVVALFVIYHLLHFTWGTVHQDFIYGDVYHNVVVGFQSWWVSGFYILAQVALGLHLYHGLWSMFQSMGWNHPRYNHWRQVFARTFAVLITVGNISFPLAVLSGLVS